MFRPKGQTRLEPPRVGGEIDGEPAVRAFAADRPRDFAPDRIDSRNIVELHPGRHRDVDFYELGAAHLGDIACVGLEAVAFQDVVHHATDVGVEFGWRDQQDLGQRLAHGADGHEDQADRERRQDDRIGVGREMGVARALQRPRHREGQQQRRGDGSRH